LRHGWEVPFLKRGYALLTVGTPHSREFTLYEEELPMIRMPKMWFGLLALVFVLGLSMTAFAADAKGTIKSVDATKNQFVLTDSNGKDWTILVAKDAKVVINDKEAKLADLKGGEEANVTYEKKGDDLMASAIKATKK
jgi:hypothetical protein